MTLEEELVHFVYGLVRGSSPRSEYRSLLERIFFENEHHPNADNLKAVSIALVAHTRDTVDGKGECTLFYELMEVLITVSEERPIFAPLVKELLYKTVHSTDSSPPYGSWKDVKYLLSHLRTTYGESRLVTHPMFEFAVQLLARQLLADSENVNGPITLAAKWAPREKSSFGWQTPHVAAACFPELSLHSGCRAYRKMLSALNTRLNTVQVLQCGRRWSEIDFDKHVTGRTLFRQRNAFARGSNIDSDRRLCRRNFVRHIGRKDKMKHQGVSVGELVREACFQSDSVDAFWTSRISRLGLVIPFVDTSASVAGTTRESLYAALGIGIQIAEHSAFGRRLCAFSSESKWVNLDGVCKLTEMVDRIPKHELGSNLKQAIATFLEFVVDSGVASTLSRYTIVVVSDMNFDNGYNHTDLRAQFEQSHVPLPHIVYWNVSPTNHRLNVDITDTNVTLISGFQVNAINRIVYKKTYGGNANTLWNKLINVCCTPRYSWAWSVI